MAENELQKLSKSQLARKAKQNKGYMLILLAILVIYGIATFVTMFKGSYDWKSPTIAIPFLLILFSILFQQRNIKYEAELKNRK